MRVLDPGQQVLLASMADILDGDQPISSYFLCKAYVYLYDFFAYLGVCGRAELLYNLNKSPRRAQIRSMLRDYIEYTLDLREGVEVDHGANLEDLRAARRGTTCPDSKCRSPHQHKNGSRENASGVVLQQWRCMECGKQWSGNLKQEELESRIMLIEQMILNNNLIDKDKNKLKYGGGAKILKLCAALGEHLTKDQLYKTLEVVKRNLRIS